MPLMTPQNNGRLITINGQELYIEFQNTRKNRPTLVFLHDSLGCTALWRNFPQKLAEAAQCNVLVYDRLGYGKSAAMLTHERPVRYLETEAAVLDGLLAALDIHEALLFGHSDGGSIALITASRYGQRIRAVICEAAHIFVEEVTLQGIREAMEAYKTTSLPERLQKYHGDKVDTLFKAWTETWTRDDFREWNIESFLSGITCPLLFVQGEADEYGTMEQAEKTVSQVSGKALLYSIPEVGHTPHKEAPELTLRAAKNFIDNLG
ncbi:pimeloyl-ACP methyl ester carboxylesterase [Flavobacterium endophyticum]|uniref:Pimeloyl-ACP methyl ester carboxylesterase n=2 Tax=Flavobacterium endophyticum TaxID=1540163 RepID=A0A495MMY5_9FLAO|nr:pimeloyl-ACP methyl ester carboxylesterase [Flavobacterium endophyticum]